MATIGLSKPFYAKYSATGTTVTYSAGGLLGKAVEVSIEPQGSDSNILYADNGPAESASMFAGGTLSITTDDLMPDQVAAVLGLTLAAITNEKITTTTPKEIIFGESQTIPYVGFGTVIKRTKDNVTKYLGVVLPKVQFSNPGVTAKTQGDKIEWQTPQLTATIMRDDTTKQAWCRQALLDTEADAEAYIKGILNITD